MSVIVLPHTPVSGQPVPSVGQAANFTTIRDAFNNTAVQTDVAKTIGVAHTFGANILFTDALYDIGQPGATRPRDLHLSRNIVVGGTAAITGAVTLSSTLTVPTSATVEPKLLFGTTAAHVGLSGTAASGLLVRKADNSGYAALTCAAFTADGTAAVTGAVTLSSTLNVGGLLTRSGWGTSVTILELLSTVGVDRRLRIQSNASSEIEIDVTNQAGSARTLTLQPTGGNTSIAGALAVAGVTTISGRSNLRATGNYESFAPGATSTVIDSLADSNWIVSAGMSNIAAGHYAFAFVRYDNNGTPEVVSIVQAGAPVIEASGATVRVRNSGGSTYLFSYNAVRIS